MADDANTPTDTSANQNAECNGAVNPAFEDTEGLKSPDVNDGKTEESKKTEENGHSTNGQLKSPTKDGMPPAEAVNLELVTMSPYTNSIPVKKESTELDMTDPYDEYFVPVNQHKKYIRGEKLYVTQDKRENVSGSKKKCCCGIFVALVLGAAIAVLVAVILSQENGGLTEGEARNYDKASFGGNLIPTPPPRSPPPQSPPTTDMSQIFLKNVLEGELTIDNMEFTPGLSDSNNSEFQNVASSLEAEIKRALFDQQKLHYGPSDITVKVVEFRSGSVIVTYRLGWKFKEGIHGAMDPIDVDMLKTKLQQYLKMHEGFLYNYRVPVHSIKSSQVIDGCQIDNNGCSHGCVYNATTLLLTCTCPFGYKLDDNGKSCGQIDFMNVHPEEEIVPSIDPSDNSHHNQNDNHSIYDELPIDKHPIEYDHSEEHNHSTIDQQPVEQDHSEEYYHPTIDKQPVEHEHFGVYDHPTVNEQPGEHNHSVEHEHPEEYDPLDHDHEHSVENEDKYSEVYKYDHSTEKHPDDISSAYPTESNLEHSSQDLLHHTEHSHHEEHERPKESDHSVDLENSTDYNHPSVNVPVSQVYPEDTSSDRPVVQDDMNPIVNEHHLQTSSERWDEPVWQDDNIVTGKSSSQGFDETPSEKPKEYLPTSSEPIQNPVEQEQMPEIVNLDNDSSNPKTENSTEEKVKPPDMIEVIAPDLNEKVTMNPQENNLKEMHPPLEFLPEYSTYPDINSDSQTEAIIPISEPTSMKPPQESIKEGNKTSENIEASFEMKYSTSTEPNIMESLENKTVDASPNPFLHLSLENAQEMNMANSSVEASEMSSNNKTDVDSEKIAVNSVTPVESESKENIKSSNYSEVVNDLHNIEGNPYETESLNELPVSSENPSKSVNFYVDGNLTKKPIEHNVIETFREAKANDFNNSTNGDNITNTEGVSEVSSDSTDDLVHVSSTVKPDNVKMDGASSLSDNITDSSNGEIMQDTEEMFSVTTSSDVPSSSAVPILNITMPTDVTKDSDHELVTDNPSLENTSEGMKITHMNDQVALIKTDSSSESQDINEQLMEVSKVLDNREMSVNNETTDPPVNENFKIDHVSDSDVQTNTENLDITTLSPPVMSNHDENITQPPNIPDSSESKDSMPLISVSEMPDLMGPFHVESDTNQNHNVPRDELNNESYSTNRAHIYKHLDDEANNLNSLEDDYENDHLKNKYQQQGKSKLRKNYNIKESYPHLNSTGKDKELTQSEPERTIDNETANKKESPLDSLNHLLSNEGYTTLSPLFTSKTEATNTLSSSTTKTLSSSTTNTLSSSTTKTEVNTTQDEISDQGLVSSEAYTTLTPLFAHSSPKSEATTVLTNSDETATKTPLIFDLIEGKKIEPNSNESDIPESTTLFQNDSQSSDEVTTATLEINDIRNDPMHTNSSVSLNEGTTSRVEELHIITMSSGITELPPERLENDKMTDSQIVQVTSPTTLPAYSTSEMATILPLSIDSSSETPSSTESESLDKKMINNVSSTEGSQPDMSDPVVNYLLNSTYSKCPAGRWPCRDGSGCIDPISRCDSINDCRDGSDEEGCKENGCLGNFQCATGECLKRHLVCDSVRNCEDGSDEINCDDWKCNFDELSCLPLSRKCIPSLWKCDSIAQCPGNIDEFGCKESCSNDEYFCAEGWCIPLSMKCDGKPDCAKGDDELNCPAIFTSINSSETSSS